MLEGMRAAASRRDASEPLRVLDVGCGEGQLTAEAARAGYAVVGIDVAEEPLRRARERHDNLDLRLVGVEQEWPLADASFDAVWAGETLEHVADTAAWLSQVRRVLRSGASLLLSTPAHERLAMLALALSARRYRRALRPARRSPALLHAPHARAPARGLRLREHRRALGRWAAGRAASAARVGAALALLARWACGAARGASARGGVPGSRPCAPSACPTCPSCAPPRPRLGLRSCLRSAFCALAARSACT